jgi:hypothetical protein
MMASVDFLYRSFLITLKNRVIVHLGFYRLGMVMAYDFKSDNKPKLHFGEWEES